jgi:hypothetical protein
MMVLHAQTSLTAPDLAEAIGLNDGSRNVGIRLPGCSGSGCFV